MDRDGMPDQGIYSLSFESSLWVIKASSICLSINRHGFDYFMAYRKRLERHYDLRYLCR